MRIAFVGVKRKYRDLPPDYVSNFNQFHLELPYYFARDGKNTVILTTVDLDQCDEGEEFGAGGRLVMWDEKSFATHAKASDLDVVVHWRKWFPDLYVQGTTNVINSQDHSFSNEWKRDVIEAYSQGRLHGILCFPTWHKRQLMQETGLPENFFIDGLTLGVDVEIYKPSTAKDPYQMLWASDPGRGLREAIELAVQLWRYDRRFKLHVCQPDYATSLQGFSHPAIVFRGNIPNGPILWDLFNTSGILPYTSSFKEPSSRAHRQAQSAGALVLYPPGMGSPSELIVDGQTGIVQPIDSWMNFILEIAGTDRHAEIGSRAASFANSESWVVQAQRFNQKFEKIVMERTKC